MLNSVFVLLHNVFVHGLSFYCLTSALLAHGFYFEACVFVFPVILRDFDCNNKLNGDSVKAAI